MTPTEFSTLRYGMFVHFGLYSILERGEWVMNRERIPPEEMARLAQSFNPTCFDADAVCHLARDGGMRYIVFTTMHHDGFRLYRSSLSNFNSAQVCGRDLVAEIIAAARRYGLKIGLYHSLNNWHDQPDAVAALESKDAYEIFISNTFARLKELTTLFTPFDILWYDGWWPFDATGWQAERMNAMLRNIQPHLLFNGRNGLPGDFGTPEGHLTAPHPWRPWEACMTLNDHWGYHRSDHNWKTPLEVVKMLLHCANERGNLLLNIGPRGDGSIPEISAEIIRTVGNWLRQGGAAAITDTDPLRFSPSFRRPDDRGDWDSSVAFTSSGSNLFLTLLYSPGKQLTLTGLEMKVLDISTASAGTLAFSQQDDKITIDLPAQLDSCFCPVLQLRCNRPPSIYRTGGMRIPRVKHPRYDPVTPDIQY